MNISIRKYKTQDEAFAQAVYFSGRPCARNRWRLERQRIREFWSDESKQIILEPLA